ncbi:UMF1 family MFS transporter [Aurantimicrobium minutum]|nr:UMF1 family MFS transporter [Aurantimicrobium minutum]
MREGYPELMSSTGAVEVKIPRKQVISWALWDWGTSAFSVLITTFVFARYIVSSYFIDPEIVQAYEAAGGEGVATGPALENFQAAEANLTSWVGWALAIGGVAVALVAPIVGQRTDAGGKRKLWLGINTGIVIAATFGMFFVEGTPQFFVMGIVLLTVGNVFYEMANVNYNAMLLQVSTPKTMGRVSGFGWGMGYFGGIFVLLIALIGFVLGDPPYWFGITTEAGMNIRAVTVLAAVWALVFSLPVLFNVPENTATTPGHKAGIIESYKILFRKIADLYKNARPTFYFLLASAVFRDGLAAVFAFGGILAGTVFGLSFTEVILFAIGGNLVAGIGVLFSGWIDDKIGSKRVIVIALAGLVVTGIALFFFHDGGATAFWIGGLMLTFFVGPAQASARAYLGHLAPEGQEGEIFGLYATTGRAVSFLAPSLFALFVLLGGATYYGILGIVVVLLAGLLLMLPLRAKFIR